MAIEYDFSKCMYDVSKVSSGGLLKAFPELNAYTEFVAAHNDGEIALAFCLADFESPFLKIKDYKQRLIAIFDFIGFSVTNPKNKILFDQVFNYTHERVFDMCGVYLQMQNNHDFTYWWNTNQLYYSLMIEMGKPKLDGEKATDFVNRKLKIQNQAEPIKKQLMTVEADLFSDSKMKMAIAKSKLTKTRTYAEMHADENSVI